MSEALPVAATPAPIPAVEGQARCIECRRAAAAIHLASRVYNALLDAGLDDAAEVVRSEAEPILAWITRMGVLSYSPRLLAEAVRKEAWLLDAAADASVEELEWLVSSIVELSDACVAERAMEVARAAAELVGGRVPEDILESGDCKQLLTYATLLLTVPPAPTGEGGGESG